jgi:hypothetical protein
MATVFEPIRPVPPITTIVVVYPRLSTTQSCDHGAKSSMASCTNVNTTPVGLAHPKPPTLRVFAVPAARMYRVPCGNTADHQGKDNDARDLKDLDQVAVHDEICGKGSLTSKGVTKPSSVTACTISATDTC